MGGSLRAVLIAPPGAGKGTQGKRIAELYEVPYFSSGELLRSEVAQQTPTGQLIVTLLENGELVEDAIVTDVIFGKLAATADGFVLDGFPRTLTQAVATEEWTVKAGLPLHAAIELQVPREELVDRIRRRAAQFGRSDDTIRTVLHRLDVYEREANELLKFYRQRGILVAVDGTGDIDAVTRRIQVQLDRVLAPPTQPSETN